MGLEMQTTGAGAGSAKATPTSIHPPGSLRFSTSAALHCALQNAAEFSVWIFVAFKTVPLPWLQKKRHHDCRLRQ